jgi:drug/metabolite transporter (DMT)-like permease
LHAYLLFSGQAEIYITTSLDLMGKIVGAAMFNMLALIAITTAVGITTVASASTINSLQVGFAPILAWAILAEQLNLIVGTGIILILIGVIYVQLNREYSTTSNHSVKS